ncbi:unnamed protein product [Lota lota]
MDHVTAEVVHHLYSRHSLRTESRDRLSSGDLLLHPAASHAADGGVIRWLSPAAASVEPESCLWTGLAPGAEEPGALLALYRHLTEPHMVSERPAMVSLLMRVPVDSLAALLGLRGSGSWMELDVEHRVYLWLASCACRAKSSSLS